MSRRLPIFLASQSAMLHDKLEGLKKRQYETQEYSPWMSQGRGLIPPKVGWGGSQDQGYLFGGPYTMDYTELKSPYLRKPPVQHGLQECLGLGTSGLRSASFEQFSQRPTIVYRDCFNGPSNQLGPFSQNVELAHLAVQSMHLLIAETT